MAVGGVVWVTESRWVMLFYRMPREPSTARVAVWRRLKRLGVAQLSDGVVALPDGARTREQLEWVAEDVVRAGGDASIWLCEPGSHAMEQELRRDLAGERADEYVVIAEESQAAVGADTDPAAARRVLRRLRRQLRRVRLRDYFPPPERERAERAVKRLARLVAEDTTAEEVDT